MALSNNEINVKYVLDITDLNRAATAFDKLSEEEKQALLNLKKYNSETKNTGQGLGAIGSIATKVGGIISGIFVLDKVVAFGKQVLEVTTRFEQLNKAIAFAAGSAEKGAEQFQFLQNLAQKLGVDLMAMTEGYKTFSASSVLAGVSIQETNRQFEAVTKAVSALGLSSDDAKGVFLAMGQMISKGNVLAEELRGQIGERLPGAFNLAARAMGVTTAELGKMMQKGEVASKDFLPKFATELDKTFGKTAQENVNSLTANQNKFNSAIDKMILAIGNRLEPFLKGAYQLATGIAEQIERAANNGATKKATTETIAAKKVENELAKAVFDLDQTNTIRITKRNHEQIRQKLAVQKLLEMEDRRGANLAAQADARLSKDNLRLKKLENEYKVLEQMEELYAKMVGAQITPPAPPPAPDDTKKKKGKTAKEIATEQYQAELEALANQKAIEAEKIRLYNDEKNRTIDMAELDMVYNGKVYEVAKRYQDKKVDDAIQAAKILPVTLALNFKDIKQMYFEQGRDELRIRSENEEKINDEAYKLAIKNIKRLKAAKDAGTKELLLGSTQEKMQLIQNEIDMNNQLMALNDKATQDGVEAALDANEELITANRELYAELARLRKKDADDTKEKEKYKEELYRQTYELLSTLSDGAFKIYNQNLDNELTLMNKRYQKEIELAGDNQQRKDELEEERLAKEKEIKLRQFRAEQLQGVVQATIAAAPLIVKYTGGLPATAANLALTLGALSAQIGLIYAQPVPEYAEGTKDKPHTGGWAIVGEQGTEKIVTKSGKVYFTPPRATLMDLPQGAEVIPNKELAYSERYPLSYLGRGWNTHSSTEGIETRLDGLAGVLQKLPIHQLNLNEKGFERYIRTPSRTTKILNSRFPSA
jgi:tape measure domain-containing protein